MQRSRCCAILNTGERCSIRVGGGGWDDFGLCSIHRRHKPIARCDQGLIDWACHIGELKLSLVNTCCCVKPRQSLNLPISIYGIIYSFVGIYDKHLGNVGMSVLGVYKPLKTTRFDFPIWRHSNESLFLFRRPGTHLCLGDLMDLNCDENGKGYLDQDTVPFNFNKISHRKWHNTWRTKHQLYKLLTLQRIKNDL